MKTCTRCILDEKTPNITFDSDGVCNYCKRHDELARQYPISDAILDKKIKKIKEQGKGKMYDAIAGVSGGADSSYLIGKMHEKGLRMLGVHFDNGWNTSIAENNISKLGKEYDLNMLRFRMDEAEFNDLNKSFLYASTPDADIPNDMALITCLYTACDIFDVKTILDGHSFRTEGFMPLNWSYMDGGYIISVQKKFGSMPIKTLPNLEFFKWIEWLKKEIGRFRGLYHIDYVKKQAMMEMKNQFDWRWYNSHHGENIYTKFVGAYLRPKKFGIDPRLIELSAFVRSGQVSRSDALEESKKEPYLEQRYLNAVMRRLNINIDEFEKIMNLPLKSHKDYKTYQPLFKQHKDIFKDLVEKGLVPKTFYMKYVEGITE